MLSWIRQNRRYLHLRAILLGVGIANIIIIAFFNWREVRYPSYCIWPWYIVSPARYYPLFLLAASVFLMVPRWWGQLAAAAIGMAVVGWSYWGCPNVWLCTFFTAVIQPTLFFQFEFAIVLVVLGFVGLIRVFKTGP